MYTIREWPTLFNYEWLTVSVYSWTVFQVLIQFFLSYCLILLCSEDRNRMTHDSDLKFYVDEICGTCSVGGYH